MPRFPVAFGKRKSAAHENVSETPSFRVLERPEVVTPVNGTSTVAGQAGRSFEAGSKAGRPLTSLPRSLTQPGPPGDDDNMFAGLNINRGSGSSNTTKTASTDTSSRHSAVSSAPSSAPPPVDNAQVLDEPKFVIPRKPYGDIPVPPIPKTNSGFLNRAGRTFSFGSTKKSVPPPAPRESIETPPPVPAHDFAGASGRSRGMTTSTASTATPPKIDDQEFNLDLGNDFGKMFTGFDKRASVATVRDDSGRASAPRSLTAGISSAPQPSPLGNKPPHSPFSVTSDRSNDGLLGGSSPPLSSSDGPPKVPQHTSPMTHRSNRPPDIMEDEGAGLLKESISANKYLIAGNGSGPGSGRYRRNDDETASGWRDSERKSNRLESKGKEDNMFDSNLVSSVRAVHRYVARAPSPPRNRVMTPAQFERFKQEKERSTGGEAAGKAVPARTSGGDDDEDEDNYDDDDDEMDKSRDAAKQRRKQEAHMTVYRQQMMRMTGESAAQMARPSLPMSVSAPVIGGAPAGLGGSDGSDEDEEVPLAILAAHGFPNKNRPPTRLSSVGSNSNLRASVMAPSPQPHKAGAENPTTASSRASHLPAFARNLPHDPFAGAGGGPGLARNSARDSLALGGGVATPQAAPPQPPLPPGGLVGVIASEERSRALRRGSPQLDGMRMMNNGGGFDPMAGIPSQSMYGMGASPSMPQLSGGGTMGMGISPMGMPNMGASQAMLTPGDQAQIHMSQQMQQFMQMQMQFMQMMAATQNGGTTPGQMQSHAPSYSMGDVSRNSVFGEQAMGMSGGLEPPRGDSRMRTMSMVQPSSASWIQSPGGFAPSIHIQGGGYAPSIAPSERSNIGLPGRYRPVSHAPPVDAPRRVSTMSGAITSWDEPHKSGPLPKSGSNSDNDDDDDDAGWEAMKAKREKKKSLWRSKKSLGRELGAFIS